jgi:Toprim domain
MSTKSYSEAVDDVELDYATLIELRGDGEGPLDHPCPLCGPGRSSEFNRIRPTLRTWELAHGVISFNCARCEAKGYAHASFNQLLRPRPARPPTAKPAPRKLELGYVERLWEQATPVLSPRVVAYFRFRGIRIEEVPTGVLRFHPRFPWQGERAACILARYSDAVTGEPRGLWRRLPYVEVKPMTLGPMGGCVIRLFPDAGKQLVIAEGIETALTAATRFHYCGAPLRPGWATGCANNMRRFPVLDGVERLIILVDNDASGTGQAAAAECAARWSAAGREVVRLMLRAVNSDFNDLVRS